jgi:hypothetical protein
MSIEEFDKLDLRGKLEAVEKKAVYIGKRELDSRSAILFQLDSFYVEIIYKQYRRYVEEIKTSESTDFIALYLDQIKVEI